MGALIARCRRRQTTEFQDLASYRTETGEVQADGTVTWMSWSSSGTPHLDPQPWKAYDDRDHNFVPPSTARQRRQRGVTTTSLSEEYLLAMAQDESRPRRAEHATRELARRRADVPASFPLQG